MKIYPNARPPVTCCRQEAKYCLALGSFIFIRSIKAYIYQDSKQLPLLTTSTLFSHSLCCIRARRRGEAAFNAIYTWRHNSIKRSCFVKETGIDMIILAGAREAPLFFPPCSPLCNPDPARRFPDTKSVCEHFFVQTYHLQREARLSAKTVTTLIICTTIFAIRHSK